MYEAHRKVFPSVVLFAVLVADPMISWNCYMQSNIISFTDIFFVYISVKETYEDILHVISVVRNLYEY